MTGHRAMHAGGHETATIRKYAAAMLRRLIGAAGVAAGLIGAQALAADITGAGATFPYPIYAKWADAYKKSTGIGLNYQSIGSGGGIKQIAAKTVDFGASDMPLKPEELDKSGMIQFPTVIGGDVPVVNLKEIMPGQLRLSGPLLAEIYLGKIRKWNDPAIAALNPGVGLPATDINVVHRSDGSGATFILMHKTQEKPESGRQLLKFFDWAYTHGDRLAQELDYVPMPDPVVRLIQTNWKSELKDSSGNPVY